MKLEDFQDSEPCSCETCRGLCIRPCWPTPQEATNLIDAGFGDRLMLDEWGADENHPNGIRLLCPASRGSEGGTAPFDPRRGCVMYTDAAGCELHDKGLKPVEGRVVNHDFGDGVHEAVAETWDTPEGQAVIERWCKNHGVSHEEIKFDLFEMLDFISSP